MAKYQILVDPKGKAAIRNTKTGKILSTHTDREDAENEVARLVEDDQWNASNGD